MAHAHSYQITLSNNKTEKEALNLLLAEREDLLIPDAKGRKAIVEALGIDPRFKRTFDLVRILGHHFGENQVEIEDPSSITLFEIKSTKKRLENFPKGFFFGATENEFTLAARLGAQFQFCFVSLHPDQDPAKRIAFLTFPELEKLIRTKRTQFQVNL